MSLSNSVTDITTLIRGLIKDQARTDGRDAFEFDSDNKFTLSESFPSEASIRVFVNGDEITDDDWEYDSDNNQVVIDFATSGVELATDDIVLILYSFFKKYSDAELLGYLKSALAYFPQHRYKKVFEMDSDDENVISVNESDPDNNEIYFIAIIASILIDPQNIKMKTPEFELTPNRTDSDQEQIKKAFTQFKRLVGKVYFEINDIDCC